MTVTQQREMDRLRDVVAQQRLIIGVLLGEMQRAADQLERGASNAKERGTA